MDMTVIGGASMKRYRLFSHLVAGIILATLATTSAFAARDSMNVAAYTKFHTMEPYQTSARQMIQMGYLMWDPLVSVSYTYLRAHET